MPAAFLICYFISIITTGLIFTYLGRKKALIVSHLICSISIFLSGFAQNLWVLIILYSLQGFSYSILTFQSAYLCE